MSAVDDNDETEQTERGKGREPSAGRSLLADIKTRLNEDLDLSLITLFSILSIFVFTPFFLYRLALGEMFGALGNGALVVLLVSIGAYCWITGRTTGARYLIVLVIAVAAVVMVVYVGHYPYWLFPTVLTIFLLVNWRAALPVNVLIMLVVVFASERLGTPVGRVSFAASMALVAAFSTIFVAHTNFHRMRLSELLDRDPLTDALNRRGMGAQLTKTLNDHRDYGNSCALAVLDIDNFKKINDLYGHAAGDRVLTAFARRVMGTIRQSDQFYRVGGEEFVLKLSETGAEDAALVLAKVMQKVRETVAVAHGPLTVSIGVAMAQRGETWSQWLSRADRAMYRAKAEGKDRIVFDQA